MLTPTTPDLIATVIELQARVASLEARLGDTSGVRDGADRRLLEHLARLGATFTTAEVFRHATVDLELGERLEAADIDNPKQLGKLLKTVAERGGGDVVVRRGDEEREGIRWSCGFAGLGRETRGAADSNYATNTR